jgi:hypothetical protein
MAARIRFSAGFCHQLEVGDALADGNLKLMGIDDGGGAIMPNAVENWWI